MRQLLLDFDQFKVGDRVVARKRIIAECNDCHPTYLLAAKGDVLVVRDVNPRFGWIVYVSHEEVADNSFGVKLDEIIHSLNERDIRRCLNERLKETVNRPMSNWYRASGEVVCKDCGYLYRLHPEDPKEDHLIVLCSGDRVHL